MSLACEWRRCAEGGATASAAVKRKRSDGQARGKSGPLFHFDVHDDVRLNINAKVEKEDSHAGKIVERHWCA